MRPRCGDQYMGPRTRGNEPTPGVMARYPGRPLGGSGESMGRLQGGPGRLQGGSKEAPRRLQGRQTAPNRQFSIREGGVRNGRSGRARSGRIGSRQKCECLTIQLSKAPTKKCHSWNPSTLMFHAIAAWDIAHAVFTRTRKFSTTRKSFGVDLEVI